jgi:hypothetical protein
MPFEYLKINCMEKKFVFTAKYLGNLLVKMIIPCSIISLILFLSLEMKFSYKYFISMTIVFVGIVIVFHKNKHDVHEFIFNDDELEFSYFNKIFFRKEKMKIRQANLEIDIKVDQVILREFNEVVGIIRRCTTDENNWNEIVHALTTRANDSSVH